MVDLSWWKRLSTSERGLTVITFSVVLVCISTAIGVGIILTNPISCNTEIGQSLRRSLPQSKFRAQTCRSEACVHASGIIYENMNISVNPCDDFYTFACGNFLQRTTIPDDKSLVDGFTNVQKQVNRKLKASVERRVKYDDLKSTRLVKTFYKSCMDQWTIEKQGVKPLVTMLKRLGGWPVLEGDKWDETKFHWMESVFQFRDMGLPINFFIELDIVVDLHNTSGRIISIDQPSLGLLYEFFMGGKGEEIREAYFNYMVEVAVFLGADKEVATAELTESLKFERRLAAISLSTDKHRAIAKSYKSTNISQLLTDYPSIPWKKFINRLVAPKAGVRDDEKVNVRVPGYLYWFPTALKLSPPRAQANYVMWRVIATSIPYLNEDLRMSQQKFKMKQTGQPSRPLRWEECIKLVSNKLPLSVGSLYVKDHFDESSKKQVVEMVRAINKELNTVLQTVPWMDGFTRYNALYKCSTMAFYTAYPDELVNGQKLDALYKDLELSEDSYLNNVLNLTRFKTDNTMDSFRKPFNKTDWANHGDVAIVNAFYSFIENSIRIPTAILQGMLFDIRHPQYMNYGGIGFIIGHEMTHGFDDLGRYFDRHGNIASWWSPLANKKFRSQVNCIIAQYDKYIVPEIGQNMDGSTTRNENIADNGGIKLAYLAYKRWASAHRREMQLPGLDYTPQQMFWISMASNWCSKYRPRQLKYMIVGDPHSPAQFRVHGTMSNMVDFARDFKCSRKSGMNPTKKCAIW